MSIYFIPIIHGVMMHNVIQKFVPKKKKSLLKIYSCIPSKYKNKHKINYSCIKGPMITQEILWQSFHLFNSSHNTATSCQDPEMKKILHKTESFRNYKLVQSAQQNTIMYWYNILPRLNYNLLCRLQIFFFLLIYFGLEINQSNKMNKYNDILAFLIVRRNIFLKILRLS